jgi:hypothetical protein
MRSEAVQQSIILNKTSSTHRAVGLFVLWSAWMYAASLFLLFSPSGLNAKIGALVLLLLLLAVLGAHTRSRTAWIFRRIWHLCAYCCRSLHKRLAKPSFSRSRSKAYLSWWRTMGARHILPLSSPSLLEAIMNAKNPELATQTFLFSVCSAPSPSRHSLTVRSTRTQPRAMPSAFSWPLVVPSALKGSGAGYLGS